MSTKNKKANSFELANNHTDTLGMGHYIDDINELKSLPIEKYDISELSREEYEHSVLSNSCISIDEF